MEYDSKIQNACQVLDQLGLFGQDIYRYIIDHKLPCEIITYSKDETVYSRHHFKKAIGVILEGQLHSYKRIGSGEMMMRSLRQGDVFGVAGLFAGENEYVSDIVSSSDSCIVYFSESLMTAIFAEDHRIALSYIRLLTKKIRYLNFKLDGFAAPNAYGKLALFLYENNGFNGTMSQLADMLAMSRMTLYRNLDLLVSKGFIEKNGKCITVLKPDKILTSDDADTMPDDILL